LKRKNQIITVINGDLINNWWNLYFLIVTNSRKHTSYCFTSPL